MGAVFTGCAFFFCRVALAALHLIAKVSNGLFLSGP
jgi:hypothetical protein